MGAVYVETAGTCQCEFYDDVGGANPCGGCGGETTIILREVDAVNARERRGAPRARAVMRVDQGQIAAISEILMAISRKKVPLFGVSNRQKILY
jgi:hypothetical protein